MESLYRKYRPQVFSDMVGQQHIVSTLHNALAESRVAHAYLFSGPRGTGKTSTARMLAKALLCEHGPTPDPDGSCEQCVAIAEGRHPDVFELDAASRTGVDNVREEIINRVAFAPTRGRSKVYIIDEVHMLTTQAFNALLKTLEEPPAHVVFILCTTDPQKVPETILSRCQRLEFHRIATEDIDRRLAYVCEQEGFVADPEALSLIARHSRGGMRDALSMLEQLSVFGDGAVRLEDAQSVLGEVGSAALAKMVEQVAKRDVAGCFAQVAELAERGADITQYVRDLTSYVRDLYVVSVAGTSDGVVSGGADAQALGELAREVGGPDRLARMLDVLGELETLMRSSLDQRLSLEVALTRIARPQADLTIEALAERVASLEAQVAALVAGGTVPAGVVDVPAGRGAAAGVVAAGRPGAGGVGAPAEAGRAGGAGFGAPTGGVASGRGVPAGAGQPAGRAAGASYGGGRPGGMPASSAASGRPGAGGFGAPAGAGGAGYGGSRPAAGGFGAAAGRGGVPASTGAGAQPAGAVPTPAGGAAPMPASILDEATSQRLWAQFFDRVRRQKPALGGVLGQARGVLSSEDTLSIVSSGSPIVARMVTRADNQQILASIASEVYGRPVQVRMAGGAPMAAPGAPASTTAGAGARAVGAAVPSSGGRSAAGSVGAAPSTQGGFGRAAGAGVSEPAGADGRSASAGAASGAGVPARSAGAAPGVGAGAMGAGGASRAFGARAEGPTPEDAPRGLDRVAPSGAAPAFGHQVGAMGSGDQLPEDPGFSESVPDDVYDAYDDVPADEPPADYGYDGPSGATPAPSAPPAAREGAASAPVAPANPVPAKPSGISAPSAPGVPSAPDSAPADDPDEDAAPSNPFVTPPDPSQAQSADAADLSQMLSSGFGGFVKVRES